MNEEILDADNPDPEIYEVCSYCNGNGCLECGLTPQDFE